jgi:methanogenic corrinoid protein MtbC1
MDIKAEVLKTLRVDKDIIVENIVDSKVSRANFTQVQRQAAIRDAKYNIEYLANAIEINSVANFNAYIIWLRDILRTYNFEDKMLIDHLNRLLDYIVGNYTEEFGNVIEPFIAEGISSIINGKGEECSYLESSGELEALAHKYFNALMRMDKGEAVKLILDVVEQDEISVKDLYLKVFTNVLYEIGRYWAMRKITVGEEHFATAVTVYTMSLLYDKIFNYEKKEHKMIGVCVGDELHEIGIRMVCDIFEINKWDTYYLGANVPNESVLSELKRVKPDILAISVTLANKVPSCTELIGLIKKEYSNVKIIVGGRPFNTDKNLWKIVGADGYSIDANEAVKTATSLVGGIRG